MFDREDLVPLHEDEFRLLRDLIRERYGIFFDDGSLFLLQRRLSRRVALHHLNDFRGYYRLLLYDKKREEELAAAIDLLTVNETFFFREQNQLKAFSEEILAEIKETNKNRRKIRIWSAGCSTGEEPYTIAILILDSGFFDGWEIEILGSDINQRVLTAARRGVYRKTSFRSTDTYFIVKYFKEDNGLFTISDDVKRLVSFSYLNLLDPLRMRFVGPVDLVFCRNVLIYFDQESRKKVVDNFYESLVEGGHLLLGHAESLMNITTSFALRHLKHDMVYQKPQIQGIRTHAT